MQHFTTPMMQQYLEVKKGYPDCMLFFRMGDFYELFMEDAHIGSRILNITLTSKAGGKDGKIPMAGVPYHAVDAYIGKLVKSGYKVAICEQLSPPNKKGLVKRGVVRVVTPGTLLEQNSLENKSNNYIICLSITATHYALAIADLSTGYFALKEELLEDNLGNLMNDIAEIKPTECLVSHDVYNTPQILKVLHGQNHMNIFAHDAYPDHSAEAKKILIKHFSVASLAGFGVAEYTHAFIPGAALITYLKHTQNGQLPHITRIIPYNLTEGLKMDRSTIANLELFATLREYDTKGSLLSVLDHTVTSMGGRMLKTWLKKPLTDKEAIGERHVSVAYLTADQSKRALLRELLKRIPDIERVFSRLCVQLGNARDVIQMKEALVVVLAVKKAIADAEPELLMKQEQAISSDLEKLIKTITTTFVDEPRVSIREGGMIREGVNPSLDKMKRSIMDSKKWITDLEKREKARTGITTLKVTFNKVFGFSIEVSHANSHLVPPDYIRKQTLVNAERYITEELKKHEEIILTAEERINDIEYKIFLKFLEEFQTFTNSVQRASESIACIDILTTFSVLADTYGYTKPTMLYSGELRIKEGRHPVVERLLEDVPFVPNDLTLDNVSQSLLLITGPNMAGKSVLMRQVALIVLMAQIGSFVPASTAHISVVDRIFVRSGASDFITSGLSTFMVEMVETADILNNATANSLIIMDEIGRGTSTYDGISLAWSVAEFLVTQHTPPPKVLFATHYHELQELEKEFPKNIKNYHMAVAEENGNPVFLHTLLPGGASHSFGISVAKLAGVPETVLTRAESILEALEKKHSITTPLLPPTDYRESQLIEKIILRELEGISIGTMTPLQALNFLASLKEKYDLLHAGEIKQLESD